MPTSPTVRTAQQDRARLQGIAHRAMLERGLLPTFSDAVVTELQRLQMPAAALAGTDADGASIKGLSTKVALTSTSPLPRTFTAPVCDTVAKAGSDGCQVATVVTSCDVPSAMRAVAASWSDCPVVSPRVIATDETAEPGGVGATIESVLHAAVNGPTTITAAQVCIRVMEESFLRSFASIRALAPQEPPDASRGGGAVHKGTSPAFSRQSIRPRSESLCSLLIAVSIGSAAAAGGNRDIFTASAIRERYDSSADSNRRLA